MSFLVDPDLYDYSTPPNVCPLCFDADKSPEIIFINVADIKIGDLWVPADPPPPNGNWAVHISAPCVWSETIGAFDFALHYQVDRTSLDIDVTGGAGCFLHLDLVPCTQWFQNEQLNPAVHKYYEGYARVVPVLEGGAYSIQELMALFSDDPTWAKYCNPIADDAESTVYKLYNPLDHTNVKIKRVIP